MLFNHHAVRDAPFRGRWLFQTSKHTTGRSRGRTEPVSHTAPRGRVAMSVEPLKFELPKFEFPKFDLPKLEVPAAFRDIAEKSIAQAKTGYEKMKSAAEETTTVLEDTYAKASKGTTEYNLKLIEAARANTNAAFDFASELCAAKSLSDVVELSTAHARKHFEALTAQSKELAALAQKIATETAEPIKEGVGKVFKQAA
jgi:phasin